MRAVLICCLVAFLSACAGARTTPPSIFHDAGRETPQRLVERPAYPGYGAAVAKQTIPWTVDSLVQDFIELNLTGEWERNFDRLLRWEGPVRVALVGPELQAYRADVAELVAMIAEAAPGLDISLAPGEVGEISIRTAPREEMKALDESALCFITPFGLDWPDYLAQRGRGGDEWAGLTRFEAMTIFIPARAAPQVYRACFVEEVMQALGPSNDLYLLEDSGFNDDEVHAAPTAFDLLMLRVLYDPALAADMTPAEARLSARGVIRRILAEEDFRIQGPRLRRPRSPYDKQFQNFHFFADVLEDVDDRRDLIRLTIDMADGFAANDHRLGEALRSAAYFENAHGAREAAVANARAAVAHFEAILPPTSARLARTRADLGYFLILDKRFEEAAALLAKAEPVVAAHGKEADLASVMRLRAIALAGAGRLPAAREAADRALDWAAYVFGADSRAVADWRDEFAFFEILG